MKKLAALLFVAWLSGCCPDPHGWEIRGPALSGTEVIVHTALSMSPCGSAPPDGIVEYTEAPTVECGDSGTAWGCCTTGNCPPYIEFAKAPDALHSSLIHEMGHAVWKHCYGRTVEPAIGPADPPEAQEFSLWLISVFAASRSALGVQP